MPLALEPLANHPAATAADVMHRAFQGYVGGEMNVTPELFAALSASVDVNPGLSRLAFEANHPIALALIARRGWRLRLAAMGVVPERKGRGVGKELLSRALEEARARGERVMELECFEQNAPGVRLYEGAGFRTRRRLLGFSGRIAHAPAELETIDPAALAGSVQLHGLAELPWQVSAPSLLKAGHPQLAYRLGASEALVHVHDGRVQLTALITPTDARRRGEAARLLGAIAAAHDAESWGVAPICPEELAPFFQRVGLVRTSLNQVQMIREL